MKHNYLIFTKKSTLWMMLLAAGLLTLGSQAFAQRVVKVDDGAILSDIINGDTTANGDRVDVNTIYELKMNGLYPVSATLSINAPLHIRAEAGTGFKPAIYAVKDASNKWPILINNTGDIMLEGIYLSNANGIDETTGNANANPKFGGFRASGPDSRVTLKDCQFEYDKGTTLYLNADGISVYVENCVAAKTGNYREYNGNGRLVDTRGHKADSIVVQNCTEYYMQDRFFRNMGGEVNYIEFDHNTIVNNQGFHGCFALAKVHHAKITNNLVINGMYGGNHPHDKEQTGPYPDNLNVYMITMDTIYSDTKLEIHNNNIACTSDLIAYFNSNDSVSKPEVLAPIIKTVLGADTTKAFIDEPVSFTNMPGLPIEFLTAIYADPTAASFPDNWPDEIGINNIDASYSTSSASATGDENGKPLGDPRWMMATGVFSQKATANNALNALVYPNPARETATLSFNLQQNCSVEITVFDVVGKQVNHIVTDGNIGQNRAELSVNNLPEGLYMYTISAANQVTGGKFTISK